MGDPAPDRESVAQGGNWHCLSSEIGGIEAGHAILVTDNRPGRWRLGGIPQGGAVHVMMATRMHYPMRPSVWR